MCPARLWKQRRQTHCPTQVFGGTCRPHYSRIYSKNCPSLQCEKYVWYITGKRGGEKEVWNSAHNSPSCVTHSTHHRLTTRTRFLISSSLRILLDGPTTTKPPPFLISKFISAAASTQDMTGNHQRRSPNSWSTFVWIEVFAKIWLPWSRGAVVFCRRRVSRRVEESTLPATELNNTTEANLFYKIFILHIMKTVSRVNAKILIFC